MAVQQELSPSVLAVVSVDGVVVCCRSFVVVFSRFNCFLFLFFFLFVRRGLCVQLEYEAVRVIFAHFSLLFEK